MRAVRGLLEPDAGTAIMPPVTMVDTALSRNICAGRRAVFVVSHGSAVVERMASAGGERMAILKMCSPL